MHEPTPERDAALLDFVESDGEPMGETELHVDQIMYLRGALDLLLRLRRRDTSAHVGANLIFYWDPEDARKRLSPDVFVVRGLTDARRRRRTWKLWDEGRAPELIIEVASRSTYAQDLGEKREVYRDVFRTSEYVVFDPEGFMDPGPLVAWRLGQRGYRRAGSSTRVESRVLGATLQVVQGFLRVVDEHGLIVPGDATQALRDGRAEGIRRGRAEGGRKLVQRLLERRFGSLGADVRRLVESLGEEELDLAAEQAATVPSAKAWVALRAGQSR